KARYGIAVEMIQPEMTVSEYEAEHGGPLYTHRSDQCCHDRKILPLRRAVVGYEAWISAIRRDQTTDRQQAALVQWDSKFELVKVNPLLTWTRREVWGFIHKHEIPYNPLHDRNYASIGCWPCTQPIGNDEDERAGRWAGRTKKECGLHVIEHQQGSGI
ncbi:MAG TPA: phosphoadenylyl-sulfate reductase, partial [Gemmataceae bacterium]